MRCFSAHIAPEAVERRGDADLPRCRFGARSLPDRASDSAGTLPEIGRSLEWLVGYCDTATNSIVKGSRMRFTLAACAFLLGAASAVPALANMCRTDSGRTCATGMPVDGFCMCGNEGGSVISLGYKKEHRPPLPPAHRPPPPPQ